MMEGNQNLIILFFKWWYGDFLASIYFFVKRFFSFLADLFSVKNCFRTLLYPWRRDQYDYAGLTIQERFNVGIMNFVSRFVGFFVKMGTIAVFCIIFSAFFILIFSCLAIFICYPVFIIWLFFHGLGKIF